MNRAGDGDTRPLLYFERSLPMSEIKVENPGTEETTPPDKEGKKAETKAELAEKNKALEAELEALKAELNAKTTTAESAATENAVSDTALPDEENDPRRLVELRLPKSRYQSAPRYVALGDYNAMIPRGVTVKVPFFVAEHVRECEEQDEKTATMLTKMQNDYAAETDRMLNR